MTVALLGLMAGTSGRANAALTITFEGHPDDGSITQFQDGFQFDFNAAGWGIFTDSFVGGGYGVPTPTSMEAASLLARTEALFLDQTYTAKAMAGLIARVRSGAFRDAETVLFWHTGGQVGMFA